MFRSLPPVTNTTYSLVYKDGDATVTNVTAEAVAALSPDGVVITHKDGSTETVETKAVFSLSILTDAYWGEIKGQRLMILYDATDYAERVVAIKRLED